jgi:hypothetical protein
LNVKTAPIIIIGSGMACVALAKEIHKEDPTPYIPARVPGMLKTPAPPVAIFAPANIDIADWYI